MKTITAEIRAQLRAEFPQKAYSKHPTKTYLTTLKAMYVVERLNEVFGLGRWELKHEVIKEQENQVLIKGKLVILDYDIEITEQYGSHAITGKGVELSDGYKSAITDCLSKSASHIEIGIDMFKGHINSNGINSNKKKVLIKEQYEKTLNASQSQIKAVLAKFDIKKEWKDKLIKLANL